MTDKQMSYSEYRRSVPSDSKDAPGFLYTAKHISNPFCEFGEYTYGLPQVYYLNDKCRLKVGKFCSIADVVRIYVGGNHNTDTVSTYPWHMVVSDYPKTRGIPLKFSKGGVTIGSDVWIGNFATILSGVTIGDGAVIGMNATVTKDVPPYSIVAGNPARVRKMRFDDDVIAELLRIKWWDWPIERIKEHADLIAGSDPWKLIEAARKFE